MKLTMLGTGNALVSDCYNTCFILEDNNELFMVDAGGGNQVLSQIKKAGYDWKNIRHIFLTHKHIDHLLGAVWMTRMICQNIRQGQYEGDAYIYSHKEVLDLLRDMANKLIQKKDTAFIDKRLHFVEVKDGESLEIIGHKVEFFDILSTKAKQFGFCLEMADGKKFTCCGDEPLNEQLESYAKDAKWLLHEAFCLYSQADIFKPYEKHHSTVKDASELAAKLSVENVLLYHTEEKNLANRKELYTKEAREYYNGNIFVPDDLEVIEL
ncbi:MBL fold metallo-hydrolase [Lachnospira pectinoschiza]|uniref:Ribonuclease Z n=1 Tax=Lachnospira pectinoschiza TaxID=28052 RepID=A0A1G9Y7X2_9FIRM|nr:MBL fold metallo-hydrolase [Lachnospira pectinoschiza]SDN05242.1 ribonuclease Z [Lachnospira pectinoschiza]